MKILIEIIIAFIFIVQIFSKPTFAQSGASSLVQAVPWRFAVIGDTHAAGSDTVKEMIPFILEDNPELILVCGDLVEAGKMTSKTELQLQQWLSRRLC